MPFKLKNLIKNPREIPTLPAIYYQIMEALNDPDETLEGIARVIEQDPSLTIRLLGLVNSPFFGFSNNISKLSQAIGAIGTIHLRELVLSTTVISQFKNIPEKYATMESFWTHGIACGLAAKELSKTLSLGDPDELYVIGMIHDIGSLLIYKGASEKAALVLERCNDWGLNLINAEQEVLGFDHTQVGEALTQKWDLPENFSEAIRFHHDPLTAPESTKETAILYVANYIVESSQLGSSGPFQSQPLDEKVIEFLGLSFDNIPSISKKIIRSVEDIAKVFIN
jgi:HD-like signal output (HDOD) protein